MGWDCWIVIFIYSFSYFYENRKGKINHLIESPIFIYIIFGGRE